MWRASTPPATDSAWSLVESVSILYVVYLVRLYDSAVCPCSIESIGYVDHKEECEQIIAGTSRMRSRIPHSNGLWYVGTFIALVMLFTDIVPVNQVYERFNIKRLI